VRKERHLVGCYVLVSKTYRLCDLTGCESKKRKKNGLDMRAPHKNTRDYIAGCGKGENDPRSHIGRRTRIDEGEQTAALLWLGHFAATHRLRVLGGARLRSAYVARRPHIVRAARRMEVSHYWAPQKRVRGHVQDHPLSITIHRPSVNA